MCVGSWWPALLNEQYALTFVESQTCSRHCPMYRHQLDHVVLVTILCGGHYYECTHFTENKKSEITV